jgi:CheY-like chemotaxis protein
MTMSTFFSGGREIQILLVEDVPDEAERTMDVLREGRVRNQVHWVGGDRGGEEAIAFLNREGPYAAAPRPDLILLDLNMPRMDGHEVLAIIKEHPNWKRIPVVIMTARGDEKDIFQAYDHHANCYITKPIDMEKFIEAVRSIEDFWMSIVRLPAA